MIPLHYVSCRLALIFAFGVPRSLLLSALLLIGVWFAVLVFVYGVGLYQVSVDFPFYKPLETLTQWNTYLLAPGKGTGGVRG